MTTLHYFTFGPIIAAVEDAGHAARYEAAGWTVVTRAAFIAAWWEKDRATFAAMGAPQGTRARIVGALPGVVYPLYETGV